MKPARFRIAPLDGGLFDFDECGQLANVLAVTTWRGEQYDAVAWLPDNPSTWWLAHKAAKILGERELFQADWHNRAVNLYETPADWLNAKNAGDAYAVAILDWTLDPRFEFARAPRIVCQSARLRDRLEKRIAEAARPRFRLEVRR